MPALHTDVELVSYIDRYKTMAKNAGLKIPENYEKNLRVVKIVDSFADDPTRTRGVDGECIPVYGVDADGHYAEWSEIQIYRKLLEVDAQQKEVLQAYSQTDKQWREWAITFLLFHELTHCFLSLGHSTDPIWSIMSPSIGYNMVPSDEDWQAELDQLFSKEYLASLPTIPLFTAPPVFQTSPKADGADADTLPPTPAARPASVQGTP